MSVDAIEMVERVLDRVFAHPNRQFAVSALDLARNWMKPSALAVVVRIAYKCRYVYGVSELRLDEIMPGIVYTTPREYLDIMRAAYGVDRAPMLTAATTESRIDIVKDVAIRASMLRSVSMKRNYVCLDYFAALFSALRYGCPIHEDFSQYTSIPNDRKGLLQKTLCRSWHAFGLFYPRPKCFGKLLDLRNVGCLECTSEVVEPFTKVLHNPAKQLAYGGVDPTGTDAAAT
ncbi:hypothetical protein V7S43_007886 [Phytophthora oleae]|uniref:Uncharacterized protein n=1 Tax=Phytophthora oleae TaxID=2107226 RepID=A0ABD3FMY0_9STRA